MAAVKPILSINLIAFVDTNSLTKRCLTGSQKRFDWRLGMNLLFTWFLACETWLPDMGLLLVILQTLLILSPIN